MLAAEWQDPAILIPFTLVLGLIIGSFLNVVIARLPTMLERQWTSECREILDGASHDEQGTTTDERFDLIHPRSRCPDCNTQIRALDNVPLLSWLCLRGRCRACGARISVQYPLVEGLSALLALAVLLRFGPGWQAGLGIVATWMLITAAMIDLRTTLLPDSLTLPLLWLGLLAAVAGAGFTTPADAILGAAAGYGILWVIYHAFRILTGKEGMGYGDFKLLAALGAWVGWQGLPLTILLSSAVGAAVGMAMITLRGQDRSVPIPFGPFLAAGGWIALMWGDRIMAIYLSSF